MKNFEKTLLFTIILCLIAISIAIFVQIAGQDKVKEGCSYLDPITIDLFAFVAALFLIIEGAFRIIEHKNAAITRQVTRSIRIAFGCAIVTLHIIQFIHK